MTNCRSLRIRSVSAECDLRWDNNAHTGNRRAMQIFVDSCWHSIYNPNRLPTWQRSAVPVSPFFLSMKIVRYQFVILLLAAFTVTAYSNTALISPRSDDVVVTNFEAEIYNRINRERVRTKRSLLIWDERLAEIARGYSREMASQGFFGHSDPSGRKVQDRIEMARIRNWRKVGENLFWVESRDNFGPLAVRLWMDSPSHRDNILDRDWKSTGIGVWRSENGRFYVTQIFLSD